MQSQIPLWLQKASEEALHGVSGKALSRDYDRLSAGYRFGKPGEAKGAWLSYLAARLPATYAAIGAALAEIPPSLLESCHSLLDLGAGPGTGAWAVASRLPTLKTAQAVEQDAEAIALGSSLSLQGPLKLDYIKADLSAGFASASQADLVLAAYVANEMEPAQRQALFSAAWAKATQLLVWIEPGTPAGFEVILQLRSQLLEAGAHMVAPCPHGQACPMAANPREKWCHFSQRLERNRLSKLAKAAELGYEDEKFSYLVLSRQPVALLGQRVVGYPKKREGQVQLELCATGGLKTLKLTRRDKPHYKAAKKAAWGDLWNPEKAL